MAERSFTSRSVVGGRMRPGLLAFLMALAWRAGSVATALSAPRLSFDTHAGIALPLGRLGDALNGGWVAGLALRDPITPTWSLGIESSWAECGGSDDATKAERERLSALAGRPVGAHLGSSFLSILAETRWSPQATHPGAVYLVTGLGAYRMRHTLESEVYDRDSTETRFGMHVGLGGDSQIRILGAALGVEGVFHWMGNARTMLELRGRARWGSPP